MASFSYHSEPKKPLTQKKQAFPVLIFKSSDPDSVSRWLASIQKGIYVQILCPSSVLPNIIEGSPVLSFPIIWIPRWFHPSHARILPGYHRGRAGSFPKYLRAISGLPGSYFWSTTGQLRFYHRVTDGPQRARARRMNSTAFRLKSFQGVAILVFGLTSWWFRTMVLRYRLASAQRF